MRAGSPDEPRQGADGPRDLLVGTILDWPAPRGERVAYRSHGACLVFGPADRVAATLRQQPAGIRIVAFGDDAGAEDSATGTLYPGRIAAVRGHLGAFRAEVEGADGHHDVAPLSPNESGLFDLVLDLRDCPLLRRQVLPPGYEHLPDGHPARLQAALDRLTRRVGGLNKPRYFHYDVERCAHDRQGIAGCRRCLSSCPAEAISPGGDGGIRIDPYLCQGCGSCTQVCPTGAIAYAWPERRILLQRIHQLVQGYRQLSGKAPTILFYQDNVREPKRLRALCEALPDAVLPFPLHSVGATGSEVWLAALATGAAGVCIHRPAYAPDDLRHALDSELQLARSILEALGFKGQRVTIQGVETPVPEPLFGDAIGEPGSIEWAGDKRAVLMQAIHSLRRNGSGPVIVRGARDQGLGGLVVDEGRCTLCGACVRLCPTSALSIQQGNRLMFDASDCVQCGLCVHGCPEGAMAATNSFPPDDIAMILFTDAQPARCVRCGEPFSSQRLVERSIDLASSLPFFTAEQVELLRMCPACRQRASVGQS